MSTHHSSPDLGALLAAGSVPLLPFGAFEQHGPHLPLSTDTIMARALAERLCPVVDGVLLPAVEYGQTTGNDGFPGTLSLSFDTVRAIAGDLISALHRQGARALVIVNGDFGNRAPLALAARDAKERNGFPVLVLNYPGMTEAFAAIGTSRPAGFGLHHADELETSIVLAVAPEAVDMSRAVAEYPVFPPDFPDAEYGMAELGATGVFGDPTHATAEKGEALLDALTAAAARLIGDFLRLHPQDRTGDRTRD
ncbi:creatininase family protein [Nakamurella sp. YIM 132087]|uniref:Creatininase family protein n=1 Tax=Nakamurella alba TaxID=2665158 RepID=A0A7K1FLH4_9ACTN|nr:creatininase family protein [Nakamurella alba]MTD14239.1 creatininase family protein [Nakamurella alba]